MATARRLANQHRLNHFFLPNPIRQLLCGSFTGPGGEAMAITIGAPTCWPVQHWAVFSFTGGVWRLVLEQPAYLIPPLAAVGSDVRETTAVHRPGDSRCNPSGGTRARTWHWNGTRFTASAWKQVTVTNAEFYSPSRNVSCTIRDDPVHRSVDAFCRSNKRQLSVVMGLDGQLRICRATAADPCIGFPAKGSPTLGYDKQIIVGRFRCLSLRSGIKCTVIRSGKGFLIDSNRVRGVGP